MMESGISVCSDKEERLTLEKEYFSKRLQTSSDGTSTTTVRENLPDEQKRKYGKKGRRKSGSKKHRAGRYRKRKYKPYHKMTFSEKQIVEERNAKRSRRKMEYYQSCGLSLAPPNTNEFLIQDRWESMNFNSENSSSDRERDDEFMAMWNKEVIESYQFSTDQQLRERYIELEDELAKQEKEKEDKLTKIRIYQDEVRNLEGANELLLKLNARLAKVLDDMRGKQHTDVDKNDVPVENDSSSADM